ncbi:MAG: 4-hydroxythreonine-4-phosphate dehydrogenase PdxA [Pirellulales bacterium]
MEQTRHETIVITCGDPAGIGPEVVIAAWVRTHAHAVARLRIVGDPAVLSTTLATVPGLPSLAVDVVGPADARPSTPDRLLVVAAPGGGAAVARGSETAAGGAAAVAALDTAWRMLAPGAGPPLAAALVTGPLHKGALHAAGHDVPGHTEWLARACGMPDDAASMMLWLPPSPGSASGDGLGVVHATLHESLISALARLSTARITAAGRRLHPLLTALLGRPPRIAVAALNPHGGEGGLFGDEERRFIVPAVNELMAAGCDASGPWPADTLFQRAAAGRFDGVVALYHDQGHIPIKLLGMHRAVNITLGLPLVRTSVAHGTAFDIVGTGQADPSSMLAAIDAAVRLVAAGWRGDD